MSVVPLLVGVQLSEPGAGKPLLLLGPSLGASVESLWATCAADLAEEYHVVGWDLPGHGRSKPASAPYLMADLAAAVLALVDRVLVQRDEPRGSFAYAGDSIGGAVGQQLLLDQPGRISAAVLACTAAKLGKSQDWLDRAELVRASGTSALITDTPARWFAPGFVDREPQVASRLLHALQDADDQSYAWACEALAAFDVRDRLGEIGPPVLAIAGEFDQPAPPDGLRVIADGVQRGRYVELADTGHLAPAERPSLVADLIRVHLNEASTVHDVRRSGLQVRRAVLGDAYVDRASGAADEFTQDFQDLITEYAWGTIWTRPGLDRRMRSAITLTALVAGGHHEELALHVRAAVRNGLSAAEIKEVLLQSAIYCGVPSANTAFRVAQQVLRDVSEENQ